ncbi:MAG: hypothetical protein ABR549_13370 [Mycobacteriales bacterium]
MSDDPWSRGTFAGTEEAQARLVADLAPDARVALLEQLIDVAPASGALQRARDEKQQSLDELWAAPTPAEVARPLHDGPAEAP